MFNRISKHTIHSSTEEELQKLLTSIITPSLFGKPPVALMVRNDALPMDMQYLELSDEATIMVNIIGFSRNNIVVSLSSDVKKNIQCYSSGMFFENALVNSPHKISGPTSVSVDDFTEMFLKPGNVKQIIRPQ